MVQKKTISLQWINLFLKGHMGADQLREKVTMSDEIFQLILNKRNEADSGLKLKK